MVSTTDVVLLTLNEPQYTVGYNCSRHSCQCQHSFVLVQPTMYEALYIKASCFERLLDFHLESVLPSLPQSNALRCVPGSAFKLTRKFCSQTRRLYS